MYLRSSQLTHQVDAMFDLISWWNMIMSRSGVINNEFAQNSHDPQWQSELLILRLRSLRLSRFCIQNCEQLISTLNPWNGKKFSAISSMIRDSRNGKYSNDSEFGVIERYRIKTHYLTHDDVIYLQTDANHVRFNLNSTRLALRSIIELIEH